MTPADRRKAVGRLQEQFAISERRAARLVAISRTTVRYQHRGRDDSVVRARLHELAAERPRFGYRRLHILLRREGQRTNHKRVYRLYRAGGLAVRQRHRKRVARSRVDHALVGPVPNASWTLDFMSDALSWGRRIRVLSVIDTCTREALAIEVNTSLPSAVVIRWGQVNMSTSYHDRHFTELSYTIARIIESEKCYERAHWHIWRGGEIERNVS